MPTLLSPYLCVIGAGSGGLSVAAASCQLGVPTVLIERSLMGGDCLNYGCIPSKSLIAAAHAAEVTRTARRFGVRSEEPTVDFPNVQSHVQGVIASIAPHDSQERFEGLGATVIRAEARFTSPREIEAGDFRIRAARFVVATGSSPAVPAIPGIGDVPFFTNETIFNNECRPDHLLVLGGGPIGAELAQAHRRLGSDVTMLVRRSLLGRDDPELATVVADRFRDEGIDVRTSTGVDGVRTNEQGQIVVSVKGPEGPSDIVGSHLLVATGRVPNVESLHLDQAGVRCTERGITVDSGLRTSNRRVYAIGDVTGGLQFTHVASHHAGIVIRRALFRLPARTNTRAVPWVTYTDPELAQVGWSESKARDVYGDAIRITRFSLSGNDRFRTEREEAGLIKVLTRRGRVIGTGLVGAHAGELIQPWCLMTGQRMKIGAMAGTILPYPTRGEVGKQVAGAYFTPTLFGARTRSLVRFLSRLG